MTTRRSPTPPPDRPESRVRVTVLMDNRSAANGLEHEHGLSLWVETPGGKVLIDLQRRAPLVLAPCHCTGRLAHTRLKRTFPGAVLPVGSGTVVE